MAARKKRPSEEVDALLDEMLVDAYGDDEQLTALAEGIGDALEFPLDVHVVGEPLSLVAVDFDGNARRGIVARCRREDGTEYGVSLVPALVLYVVRFEGLPNPHKPSQWVPSSRRLLRIERRFRHPSARYSPLLVEN